VGRRYLTATEAESILGLTLNCLGRHEKALRQLRKSAEGNADHQRILLTLSFVNSQLGNLEVARTALTRATRSSDNLTIGEQGQEILGTLL